MLHVHNVTKKFGKKTILQDVSFTVKPGQIIGLVGENGAGKSTLLNVLASIQPPTSGEVVMEEKLYNRKNIKKLRQKIGYVPQDIAIWEEFTVAENMHFFEKLSPIKRDHTALKQLCEDVHLNRWHDRVSTLSGGMKRKLNIAISLIHEPTYLFLDEPTVGIDLKSKVEISHFLKSLAKERGMAIVYISHDMDEIIQLCDEIYHLGADPFYKELLTERGKIVTTL